MLLPRFLLQQNSSVLTFSVPEGNPGSPVPRCKAKAN